MQRGRSRYNKNGGRGSRSGSNYGQKHKSDQSPWQPDVPRSNQKLNELNMQLEMVKRKRQMLQEQRQLMEEEHQLDRMQSKLNSNPQQGYKQYSAYANLYDPISTGEQRGRKRPAKSSASHEQKQPKRFAPSGGPVNKTRPPHANVSPPKPVAAPSERRTPTSLEREIVPVITPTGMNGGKKNANRSARHRVSTAVFIILRDMKQLYFCPPHNIKLENYQYYTLRTRVTESVQKLLEDNKPVPLPNAIFQMYRKTHTSKENLQLIQEMAALTEVDYNLAVQKKQLEKPTQAGRANPVAKRNVAKEHMTKVSAQAFLDENFKKALNAKLADIFEKVHKIYAEEAAENGNKVVQPKVEKSDEPETNATVDEPETNAKVDEPETNATVDEPETKVKADERETKAKVDESETKVEAESSADIEIGSTTESAVVSTVDEKKELSNPESDDFESRMDTMLRRKLPQLLPRYKGFILSIIARDPAFVKYHLKQDVEPVQSSQECHKFVKILGRPTLPPRAVMQRFLRQFKPATIKKHKSIDNLLFVGVPGDQFESLLEHSGHTVGTKLLHIIAAPQDWANQNEQEKSNDQRELTNGAPQTKESESVDIETDEDAKVTVNPFEALITTSLKNDLEIMENDAKNIDGDIGELLTLNEESDDANVTTMDGEVTGKTIEDNTDGTGEPKAPDTPVGSIQTRRSSRLPQKK